MPDVVDAVAHHCQTLDSHAKGETGKLSGVVADGLEHVGVDHATPQQLQPSGAATDPASWLASVTGETRNIELGAGLGEREEMRSEAHCGRRAEEFPGEVGQRALEV